MKSFFAEVRNTNTNTIKLYHLLARDFNEASIIVGAFLAGFNRPGYERVELIGLTGTKRRGWEAEEML